MRRYVAYDAPRPSLLSLVVKESNHSAEIMWCDCVAVKISAYSISVRCLMVCR